MTQVATELLAENCESALPILTASENDNDPTV